ncbi:unnamed protein product, partial [Arctogadus glacialis]
PEASSLVNKLAIIRRTLTSRSLLRTVQGLHGLEGQLQGLQGGQTHRVSLSTLAGVDVLPEFLPQVLHLLGQLRHRSQQFLHSHIY